MNDRIFDQLLPTIPGMNGATLSQIANWYDSKLATVRGCYRRNRKIIDEKGTKKQTLDDFQKLAGRVIRDGHVLRVRIADDKDIRISNRGVTVFSFAAILQIGLLLRDNPKAKALQDIRNKVFFQHINDVY